MITTSSLGVLLLAPVLGLAAAWGGMALGYRAPGSRAARGAWVSLWCLACAGTLALAWRGHTAAGTGGALGALALLMAWWTRVEPTDEGAWSDDVLRMATGTIDGNRVTLDHVRNFDWRTTADYTAQWETRHYDLDALNSVDMILSYWRGPAIAHMLMSFGFADGAHVVFSVEIRRRKTQRFSEIGGFFKEFELSIIAADERDAVRLRTNVRGEEAYLYRLRLPPAALRPLFASFVDEANRLVRTPRFYNTVTGNCTTLVYRMLRRILGPLPLDPRLLFSGYMAEYMYDLGILDGSRPLADLRARGRITERARQADRSPSFSADIRRGVP